jgi:hypothetical protein
MDYIMIDTDEMKEYIFRELVQRGYAPTEEEAEELADICFDYLLDVGAIEDAEEL